MYRKIKGTYDILPDDVNRWQQLEKVIRNVSKIYNYKEIRTPIIEHSELFHRSVGEETDIVSKETYDFIDRGKRPNTLRPEGTAGVVRSFIENKLYADGSNPVQKMYYMGSMFRYERPQKGRYREFRQFGAEAFGSTSPQLDAELIAYAVSILKALKITDVTVHLNSIGDNDSKQQYKNALQTYLKPHLSELCTDCQTRYENNPLRILDCKIDQDKDIIQQAPKPIDFLSEQATTHFADVCRYLDAMKIAYKVDKNLVRGLDYYTNTVFEVKAHLDTLGAQNTICGGGRYNHLVSTLGGPEIPGVGFAFGLERLMFALESIAFKGEPQYLHLYLMILGDKQKADGMAMINRCRLGGLLCDMDFLDKGMKGKWKQAANMNARFVAIYGEHEQQNDQINVKDQDSGNEVTISKHQLYNYIVTELMTPSQNCQSCESDDCDSCG
jgi:histidyl-tRNA synthetase